jgi:hypothetical protein
MARKVDDHSDKLRGYNALQSTYIRDLDQWKLRNHCIDMVRGLDDLEPSPICDYYSSGEE